MTNTTAGLPKPYLAALVTLPAALCVYSIRQADPDLFGYLAYGRLFIEQGLDVADPFAYTSTGSTWVAFEYLAQVALWIVYDAFGPLGLIALKCLLGGLAIYFLSIAVRATSANPMIWIPVFLVCTSTASRFFVFRPQLFTFLFFSLFIAVLFRFLLSGRAPLWVLPVAMLFWANTHGGFLAGLAVVISVIGLRVAQNLFDRNLAAIAWLRGTKPLSITLGVCVLVTFINPHGLRLWQYVSTEVWHDTNRRYIVEWQPIGPNTDPWSAIALTFIVVLLIVATVTAEMQRRLVAGLPPWLWTLSSVPAIVMATISVRHVPLAVLWMAPVICLLADSSWQERQRSLFNLGWTVAAGGTLVPVLITMGYLARNPWPAIAIDGTILGETHPCSALAFMRQEDMRGNLYLPLWWGSFFTWEMYPQIRVSMDGRNISLFPPDMVEQNLRFYSNDTVNGSIDEPLRYDTEMLLVPAGRKVLDRVRTDRRWREAFADSQSSLFVRTDSPQLVKASDAPSPTPAGTAAGCPTVLQ